ncbi:MAG: hypothetical protein L6R36_003449 [Xanthoria steineri]|nr:MAG: hypothetical protein L6R36_003449 [Xanthoria steineri]
MTMWRRTYLLLLLVRIYLALSPSYIHPDENFQGPEIIAGQIFGYPNLKTWEFTSSHPVRSVFPLWPVYGLPMLVLQWVWTETGKEAVAPRLVYYALRLLMFILSFVLEDWAIHELVQSPRERRIAVVLVASSYVTWTYQTHTFSNAVETLVVLWSIVMIQRILDNKHRSSLLSSALLGSLVAFGVCNRITIPAFLLPPGLYLLPHFLRRPCSLLVLGTTFILTSILGIAVDTLFYHPSSTEPLFQILRSDPTITPLNSLLYNTSTSNLSLHGLHPPYQHLIASLPLLLGPALLLFWYIRKPSLSIISALSATVLLSLIPHQEPRFLLPAVPLILSSVRLPSLAVLKRYWFISWIIFNAILGVLMGIYHQGGVVPAQLWLGQQRQYDSGLSKVFWWRTYSPPVWLLGGGELLTVDLMGMKAEEMMDRVSGATEGYKGGDPTSVGLVAPKSSVDLDAWIEKTKSVMVFEQLWTTGNHLNLDDLDFEADGIVGTLERVVGRRGLVIWKVSRIPEV